MKKKKPKPAKKTKPKKSVKSVLIVMKVTEDEARYIKRAAKAFAGGNVSRFLRHAAKVCKTSVPA